MSRPNWFAAFSLAFSAFQLAGRPLGFAGGLPFGGTPAPETAFSVALLALAMVRSGHRRRAEKLCAAAAAVLGFVHFLWECGFAAWAGPPPPATVACYVALLGCAVILLDIPHFGRIAGTALSSVALYFTLISVAGYLAAGGEQSHHGGVLARGSLSGNLPVAVLAVAVLWQARQHCPWCHGVLSWSPLLLGSVGLALTVVYWCEALHQQHLAAENGARLVAAEIRSRLQAGGEQMTASFMRLADHWRSQHIPSTEEWEKDTLGYFRDFKGLAALVVVDGSGSLVRQASVSPDLLDPRKPVLHLLEVTAAEAMRSAMSMTASPVAPGRDGAEVALAFPAAQSAKPRILSLLIQLKPIAEEILRSHEGHLYYVAIRVQGYRVRERGGWNAVDTHVRMTERALALGLNWDIEVLPERELLNDGGGRIATSDVFLLAGFLVTALLVAAANLWLIARERSNLVEQINSELRTENLRRAETEHALVIAKNKADEANRSKSQFLAAMSHEIRTPMNAILGMAELLGSSTLTDSQREYVRIFQSAGSGLMRLLNDILDFSKMEAGKFQLSPVDFDLRDLIDSTIRLMDSRVKEKQLQFICELDSGLPAWVHGDPERIQQILVNLLSNATKFTGKGFVALRVRLLDWPEPSTARLSFEVADSGIGIERDKLGLIFESFEQGDNSISRRFGGTGLGLAICRNLAHQMGGRLSVESTPGQGSTFGLQLALPVVSPPVASPHPRAGQPPVLAAARPDAERLRILVVDDVVENQLVVAGFLEGRSHQLEFAADGREAVERAQRQAFDLIFMDLQMPVLDGLGATRAIREFERTTGRIAARIVALSADGLPEHRQASFDAGCSDFLSKPVSKKALLRAVSRAAILPPSQPPSARPAGELIAS